MENNSCVVYGNFLPADINAALYNHAIKQAEFFSKSSAAGQEDHGIANEHWRQSLVLEPVHFKEFRKILAEKIKNKRGEIIEKLNITPFEMDYLEMQLTSHNHGEFYKPHTDTGKGSVQNRVITFVYYFHSNPKMFAGGQLLFPHNKPKPLIVEPDNNTIVFFNSSLLHAVHPVSCPSKQFEHGRFTLNGWIRKKEVPVIALS